ncbi:MAG TPA: S8 family serine peptidase [Blastocatellia bacterium]|nr:S8 family serine peptidase [Blastocatellia bacterium]
MRAYTLSKKANRTLVLALIVVIAVGSASAGLLIKSASITGSGIFNTQTNGITYQGPSGIVATGIDGLLTFLPNNITAPTSSGIVATGIDGLTYSGANGIVATGIDGLTFNQGSGIVATGIDALTITSGNNSYQVDSVFIHQANGIVATGIDNLNIIGSNGIVATGIDSREIAFANGLNAAGIDGITINGASGIVATGIDGQTFSISPNGLTISGASGIVATGIDGLSFSGANGIVATGIDDGTMPSLLGLLSLDPELAALLDRLTDDSNVNAAVVYHSYPTNDDIDDLRQIGVLLGQRYRVLPVVSVTTTKAKLMQISRLRGVRSIYSNRTLKLLGEPGNGLTGTERVKTDADLTAANGGQTVTGRNVTVAVLDTGLDSTHGDIAGRVVKNVKLVGLAGLGVNFNYPISEVGLPNTDLVSGHGTFVGGVIAGNGARSGGRYTGVAPGAKLVGLSAGDATLLSIIEGFDYLLWKRQELGVRVVNCSFSADTLYDSNDPVNVATKMLTDQGVSVVFSAGNNGPGADTLNPYAMAPWVISVGATDEEGKLADFSSLGSFTKLSGPSLVAPGVNVVSLRASGVSLNGLLNLGLGGDLSRLSTEDLLNYTVGSGTSFSAPQVAGTIAMMLDVNPSLMPAQIKDILQRTATPMTQYYRYEVGAGMLNAHAAVLEAAFPQRRMGMFRASLDRGQARFVNDPLRTFSGTVPLGLLGLLGSYTANFNIPENTLVASVQIAWGPETSINDLSLQLIDPGGMARPVVNTLNLPVLTGRRERDLIKNPIPGTWRAKVQHTIIGTPQAFIGTVENTRAEYQPLTDISGLSMLARSEVLQNLRSFMIAPLGNNFRPNFTISRFELASALVFGGRVPQYLAGQPRFTDATDQATRIMVESAQAAPGGPLFTDASPGGLFRPDDRAARLTAAIALVRAAGLRSEAESKAGISLPVSDAYAIPSSLRGYVWVALNRGLMSADGGVFRPNSAMNRVELAHAMVGIARLAIQ